MGKTGNDNRKRLIWQLPFLTFLIIGTIIIIRKQNTTPFQNDRGFVFGTTYSITYQCDSNMRASIVRELQAVDNSLSPFNDSSTITQINRGESPDITGSMFEEVFTLAERISADTDGAFDITVAPLVNAWGFGFRKSAMPAKHQVDSMLQFTGYKKVSLVKERGATTVRKADSRMMLSGSAIAKGYGCDRVAKLLRSRGVSNFMVEIGGEVVASGVNSRRQPWKIGVIKPVEDSLSTDNELNIVLSISDKAMATSGNYRNFYYKGGRKYAHTIDPRTGYPVQHNILSATVVAGDCATADAYATAFMVMGLDGARKVLARHPDLAAYFIYTDADGKNAVWYSPELKNRIQQ